MIKNVAVLLLMFSVSALAQVSVDVSGHGVHVKQSGGKDVNVDTGSSGSVAPDVEMEGVAVINGDVFVDGTKVPKGKTLYTSKKSGKTYHINWGKNGNVSVSEK